MSKIKWIKAKTDYIKDETQSFESISKKYGVSVTAVKVRASKDGWVKLRKQTLQKVNQKLPEKLGNELAEIKARHARLGRILQGKGYQKISKQKAVPQDFDDARRAIETGVKIEREALDLNKNTPPMVNIKNIIGAWIRGEEDNA
jgi:LysM repeat protein